MRILVVEDDIQLQTGLKELLLDGGYQVETAGDIREARAIRSKISEAGQEIHLVLLDIMLKDRLGFELCREIRETEETPIIFLTALDDEEHVIEGLNMGGDDYITKPFRSRELLARISAHIRRYRNEQETKGMEEWSPQRDEDTPIKRKRYLQSGDIRYLLGEERIFLNGRELHLRKVEQELLKYFLDSSGRLLRREQILEYIWDSVGDIVEDNTLSVQVSRLRKQIGKYQDEDYIETLRGIGYRWHPEINKISE